jgi:hypothetical protein
MTTVKERVEKIEVGTIFVSSWGYDQTNIDFYKVVKMTDKTVWLQEVEKEYVKQTGWAHYAVKATDIVKKYNKFIYNNEGIKVGETEIEAPIIRKKIGDSYGRVYVRISSFEYAYIWSGREEHESHTC